MVKGGPLEASMYNKVQKIGIARKNRDIIAPANSDLHVACSSGDSE